MKKLIIIASLFLCGAAYAEEWDIYAFTDYTPVRVMYLAPGANVEVEASKAGLSGAKKKIRANELPQSREHRNAWKLDRGTVKADAVLSKKMDDDKQKLLDDKASAITKLKAQGLTDDELLALNIRQEVV